MSTRPNALSLREQRVVVSKDVDFYNSFLVRSIPYKLLFVTTGNITNHQLEALFLSKLSDLVELFKRHSVIELSSDAIIVHV